MVSEFPPAVLLEPIEQPVFEGSTYGDLVLFVPDLQLSHAECSYRLITIAEWVKSRMAVQ